MCPVAIIVSNRQERAEQKMLLSQYGFHLLLLGSGYSAAVAILSGGFPIIQDLKKLTCATEVEANYDYDGGLKSCCFLAIDPL